jgi:hypothetical protein
MKRTLVLALGLLIVPAFVSAQVEVGLDAGFGISMIDDADDNINSFSLPGTWVRVAFAASPTILVEPVVGLEWFSVGDASGSDLLLLPGIVFLLGEQFYVRGEAGLFRESFDPGSGGDSTTQYAFGGEVGLRMPLGDSALFRAGIGVDRWLEVSENSVIEEPARTDVRLGVGISAVIN